MHGLLSLIFTVTEDQYYTGISRRYNEISAGHTTTTLVVGGGECGTTRVTVLFRGDAIFRVFGNNSDSTKHAERGRRVRGSVHSPQVLNEQPHHPRQGSCLHSDQLGHCSTLRATSLLHDMLFLEVNSRNLRRYKAL
ncbi:hypothetical protein V5799_019903 [Amblyomma americanum]|uniref:Uncharacterized protein n=1 Tax=Amblyomma americanum TaxID=6943 RepID=A0AAQ4EVF0_AMBAM